MSSCSDTYKTLCSFENLLNAYKKAAKGKRGKTTISLFDYELTNELLSLRNELITGNYKPGAYVNFYVHEPKVRKISAAPFRDRVVHHALCNQIEPRFEKLFIEDSFANRKYKGTHLAINRLQSFAHRFRFVLRADIVKHFPSIDHEILKAILKQSIHEEDMLALIDQIIDSGAGILEEDYPMHWFPGDDLLAVCRPRGLPIGNLTSQFWSNCYLNSFDWFVKRELQCNAYLRYVDDFALFSNSKQQLWDWKQAIIERLQHFRLVIHESKTQVLPVDCGIPWLGFVVYPTHRKVKGRKVVNTTRHLNEKMAAWRKGEISFAAFDASIQGWINYVRYADSWGLRKHVFNQLVKRRQ